MAKKGSRLKARRLLRSSHLGWKQERSIGVEAKRHGRDYVIDPKNHCQIRFCFPVLPKTNILAWLSFGLRKVAVIMRITSEL
ncbi:hypothetical protein Vadar_000916 [Vaccinium darrowii]|uniref:Uncharacterized protein n=1 Tax=Vaccinium darrowii TaxID=229202 RepID=A0ACB7YT68_9ERIC|nr:hypothetical protein Vadar_000916 [Vaccinium darrowii]